MIANVRQHYIDVAKGVGILLVLLGHIKQGGAAPSIIYAFHMPFFFLISGLLFNPNKFGSYWNFIKSRATRLLIPYFVYSLITWCFWVGYNCCTKRIISIDFYPLIQTLLAQGSSGFLKHNAPLWFITCLFTLEVIYYPLYKKRWSLFCCSMISIISMISIKSHSVCWLELLPWNLEIALACLLYYALGYSIRNKFSISSIGNMPNRILVGMILACLPILVIISHFNGCPDIGADYFGQSPYLFVFGAICGSVFLISSSIYVSRVINTSVLQWFGRNSLDIMCLHVPIKGVVIGIMQRVLKLEWGGYITEWPYALIAVLLTILILYPTIVCINRIKILYNK